MKPKNCIYPDCFNCALDDCEYDMPEKEDFNRDAKMDTENSIENKTDKQRRQYINQNAIAILKKAKLSCTNMLRVARLRNGIKDIILKKVPKF